MRLIYHEQYTSLNNHLTGNDDYGPGPYPITIPAGSTMVPFDISIVDDSILLEDNEKFNITIMEESLPLNVMPGDPSTATVTIIDDGE